MRLLRFFCLGRTVRVTPAGIEIEADKKLALKIVEEATLVGGKRVDNPGATSAEAMGGQEEALVGDEATLYRRSVAIIYLLAQDWVDLSYASMQVRNCPGGCQRP